jgi:hypothetical protein
VNTPDISNENTRLGPAATRIMLIAGVIGIAGLATSLAIAGFGDQWDRFMKSYLHSFVFIVTIALGGFFFVFVQHLTRAGWSVAVRRPAEMIASNLVWLPILFIPILVSLFVGGGDILFPWANLDHVAEHNHAEYELLLKKEGYLNVNFFVVRAIIYFAVWGGLSAFFYRNSLRQDQTGDVQLTHRMQWWSAPTALLFALTSSFAAFDWLMSLNPAWFSTMFGVYFFAGACTGFFSVLILACLGLQRMGIMTNTITAEHYQDIGKLLFAFGMVFWAYIAYSQYMLIWYANIPEETGWFMARQVGNWGIFSLVLLFGHFLVPFLFLVSKHPKRFKPTLVIASLWMLAFHWLDLYYLVMPVVPSVLHEGRFETLSELNAYVNEQIDAGSSVYAVNLLHPLNWTCLAGLGGIFVAVTAWRARDRSVLCQRDPRLGESLAFENM